MSASHQFPADAASRVTLFDQARSQGLAQELTERVTHAVKQHDARKRNARRGIGLAALLIGFSVWAIPYYRSTGAISTKVANRQTLALEDGSSVDLNAQSQLRTDFRYNRRVVRLTAGEAFFTVAKDTKHPFLVETPAGTVRVTGTKFNVRLAETGVAEVTLLEGAVGFQSQAPNSQISSPINLLPGQQLRSDEGSVHTLTASDLENVTAWREGRLVLDEMTVADAVARIARYHGKKIDVAQDVASIRLGGSCSLNDFSAFLQSLRATQAIDVMELADGTYRLRTRQR